MNPYNTDAKTSVPKAGATGLEPAASGVTGAITEGPATRGSLLFKPKSGFGRDGSLPLKNLQFAGFRSGFGHKFRLVPNRFDLPLAPPERTFSEL
jgi:hypothetical protein